MPSQDWLEKDFYSVLGVAADARAEEIKKTYRKLARKFHPDANSGDAASEARFKEIGEAYSVLGDAEQRRQYDQVRAMTRGGARFTAGGPGGAGGFEDIFGGLFGAGAGGRNQSRFTTSGGNSNLEDVFSAMFASGGPGMASPGGSGMGFRAPAGPVRGGDLSAEVKITFRQALEGAQLTLRVPEGNGARTVTARMPAGVRDGQKVRLRGKGRPSNSGGEAGDLVIAVAVEPDSVFSLDGGDIRITVPVTFAEAALGGTVEVPTVDGGSVKVKIAPGTASGSVLRVKGRGVTTRQNTGDLLVTLQVLIPRRIDGPARRALEEFVAALGDDGDPRAELLARARSSGS